MFPLLTSVNGIQLHNVEPHCTELVNILLIKKIVKDKKKQKYMEDSINYQCEKQFCSFCLKNYYEQAL
jgi:hypothetical protein